jgi:cell division protein FtsW (lipid II flippase)
VGGLLLLAATLVFGVNPSGFGARLWLPLPGFDFFFQPSELLKLLLVVYLATYLADRRSLMDERRYGFLRLWPAALGPMALMFGLALILLAWQQDLGAALLFYLTFLAMLYLTWGRAWHVGLGVLLFVPIVVGGALLSSRVALRVSIWLDPWGPEQADRAFQILQSLFALGAGGVFGEGLGQGRPTLIPAVHTDFVYAAVVDEFGALGALALLGLMAFLVQRALNLAQRSPSSFEALLAGGIGTLLGIQTWVIVAGNVKLIPITGVTLPFLSYGGSSMVTTMAALGLLLNLSAPHPPALSLPLPGQRDRVPLNRGLAHVGSALLALLALAGLGTGTWAVVRAGELRSYPTNPHRILDELEIRRGAIVGRRGTALVSTETPEVGLPQRTYLVPEAAPVVGYATLEFGTEGVEAACDLRLRGEEELTPWERLRNDLLHRPLQGKPVRLTLDAALQQQAQSLLEGRRGAAVLVDARTGAILALASSPTFDPATVAEDWEELREDPDAPLLNRATQGLVQPGAVLQPVIMAAALENEWAPSPLEAPIRLNGVHLVCREEPEEDTWAAALGAGCPAPFAQAGERLGPEELVKLFTRWGLMNAPRMALPTTAEPLSGTFDATREALGQGNLLVTPLQMAGVAAALGNDGVRPPLYLVEGEQPGCEIPPRPSATTVISPELAAQVRKSWTGWDGAIGHLGTALAGEERELVWFLGLNSDVVPRYAVVVLLENPPHAERAASVGSALLRRVSGP